MRAIERYKEAKLFGDAYEEMEARNALTEEDVIKYNEEQKRAGGFPLDPGGSQNVDKELEAIITVFRTRKEKNIEKALEYLLHSGMSLYEFTPEEKKRIRSIILDYYTSNAAAAEAH